jgi:hypothetical protein
MTEHAKITGNHLSRTAIVYLRQSSPAQVENNRESTDRQYALVRKATELGWPAERVVVIDEDLGLSGSGERIELGREHDTARDRQAVDQQLGQPRLGTGTGHHVFAVAGKPPHQASCHPIDQHYVELDGERRAATRTTQPIFDPDGKRMRG